MISAKNTCLYCSIVLMIGCAATGWMHAGYAYVYDIIFLDTMGRAGGEAYRINNRNQVIGWAGGGPLPSVSVFWDLNDSLADGATHIIDDAFVAPTLYPHAYGLSDTGIVVGRYLENGYTTSDRPFIYDVQNRTWTDLGTLADDEDDKPHQNYSGSYYMGMALAVNSSGQVVGLSDPADIALPLWRVASWGAPDAPVELSEEDVNGADFLFDLNESGDFAGTILANWENRPLKGTMSSVSVLPLPPGYIYYAGAYGINQSGWVVGFARNINLPEADRPILWKPGYAPEVLETYNHHGSAYNINNHGDIVGHLAGGAALWTWDGVHYQPIDLSRYCRPYGSTIVNAYDINEAGWIAGFAMYHQEGVLRPVVLVPRIDEEPPSAALDPDQEPDTGDADFVFSVTYKDNGLIDESTLDDSDLTVTGPNGYSQKARLEEVESVRYDASDERWYWTVKYRISAPADAWNEDDAGDYPVRMESEEVADGAAYHVPEGEIGVFTYTGRTLDFQMEKGLDYLGNSTTGELRFSTSLDAAYLRQMQFPAQAVWIRTPTQADYPLTNSGNDLWTISAVDGTAPNFSDFADGAYRVFLDFGSGLVLDKEYWFGVPGTPDPLPQPAEAPLFLQPAHGDTGVPVDVNLRWGVPADPLVNSIRLRVLDAASGRTIENLLFEETQTVHWPYAPLLGTHTYRATLSFCQGYYDQMEDAWAYSASKYTSRTIEFTTADPDPATYAVGDLDGKGRFTTTSLVILRNYLAGNLVDGDDPFTEPLLAADLNGDHQVDATDLRLMAGRMAENP